VSVIDCADDNDEHYRCMNDRSKWLCMMQQWHAQMVMLVAAMAWCNQVDSVSRVMYINHTIGYIYLDQPC
jgi:hypothetical protein